MIINYCSSHPLLAGVGSVRQAAGPAKLDRGAAGELQPGHRRADVQCGGRATPQELPQPRDQGAEAGAGREAGAAAGPLPRPPLQTRPGAEHLSHPAAPLRVPVSRGRNNTGKDFTKL